MPQVAISKKSKNLLDMYAVKNGLKKYESLDKIILQACNGLKLVDTNENDKEK